MAKARTRAAQRCPECGGPMVWETRDDWIEYQGHRRTFNSTGWWCTKCGEGILAGEELSKGFRVHAELRAEIDGVLSPPEVRAIRERLGLSQLEAGRILGGGPRAFQKYESGATPPSVPMAQLLRLLANDPKRIEELRASGDVARVKRVPRRSAAKVARAKGRPRSS